MNHDSQIQSNMFIANNPLRLSIRAQEFIASNSRIKPYERGLVGDELIQLISSMYGPAEAEFASLLATTQERYGGLSYPSGFFDADVTFAPMCEADDLETSLEILHAVDTGSITGASLNQSGEVAIGIDGDEVAEFKSLDALIECDAMFPHAGRFAHATTRYLSGDEATTAWRRLSQPSVLSMDLVVEASGDHCKWLDGSTASIFACYTWHILGSPLGPFIKVWADSQESIDSILAQLTKAPVRP